VIGIGIIGAKGRMGRAIAAELADHESARLTAGADQGDDLSAAAAGCDILIDFSSPRALHDTLAAAQAAARPLVIGTTGLGEEEHREIERAAATIPILQAANMSLGVTLLAHLVREAASRLGPDWDIEIAEMHHRHKADAPSGTALLLGEAAAQGRGIDLASSSERGRDGITGGRAQGHIGFASLRGGSVAGDHMVVLAGEGERIELSHRAETRAIFARGAVKAALWLRERPAGRYRMADVLGLS
jgi:4-hydroxy-tetrahydrodipicolinate reductase